MINGPDPECLFSISSKISCINSRNTYFASWQWPQHVRNTTTTPKKERKRFAFRQANDASISEVDVGRNVTSKNYCISSQETFPSVSEAKFDSCTDQSQMDDMKNCRRQSVVDFQSGGGRWSEESRPILCALTLHDPHYGRATQGALKVKHTHTHITHSAVHFAPDCTRHVARRQRMHIENTLSICRFDNAQTLDSFLSIHYHI